jgi:hypothetical protein
MVFGTPPPCSDFVVRTTTDSPGPMDRGSKNAAEIAADTWVPYAAALGTSG